MAWRDPFRPVRIERGRCLYIADQETPQGMMVMCWQRQRLEHRQAGFTLVEVLLVVAIMAILAAVVLPRMTNTSTDAKDATLIHNLAVLRKQIELFKAQHGGKAPGWQGTNVTLHLQAFTNSSGAVSFFASPSYPYGPYFLHGLPQNPFNSGTGFKASTNPAGETPNHNLTASGLKVGWFYDKDTGRVAPNAEGNNAIGVPRVSL